MSRTREECRPVVLVTRATGGPGGSVLRSLRARGRFAVRALTRTPGSPAARALVAERVDLACGDLEDLEALRRALAGCCGVAAHVHAAAEDAAWQQLENLLDASADAGAGHLVLALYGEAPEREIARLEGYGSSLGVTLTLLRFAATPEERAADAIAAAFEQRLDALLGG